MKEEIVEDSIKMWEKGWAHHGKAYEADAYETEEEDNCFF